MADIKQKIVPCLWFDKNCEEAMNFYVSVFKNSKIYFFVVCVVFGLVFLVHVLRIFSGWSAQVENFAVPMWFSYIALVIMGYLSYESFKHWRRV